MDFSLIRNWYQERSYLQHSVETYAGIHLCDLRLQKKENVHACVVKTVDALRLIQLYDVRRFRRVQEYIHYIAYQESIAGGSYLYTNRVCWIDLSLYDFDRDREWYTALCAATFVHEATHGFLFGRHIPYNRRTRTRIERLCTLEEKRFLQRARPWMVEHISEFNHQNWEPFWNGWNRWKLVREKIKKMHP